MNEHLSEHEWDLMFRLIEALKIVQYPKDFEAACQAAHEVRSDRTTRD